MGSFLDILKTVFLPALTSLVLYLIISYAILPFYRQYHQRYAHYLPLESISVHTSSFRSRLSDTVTRVLPPSTWFCRRSSTGHYAAGDADGSLFDEEEGEGLVGFNLNAQQRERLERSTVGVDMDQRLSRELEEVFQDSSDDEDALTDLRTALR